MSTNLVLAGMQLPSVQISSDISAKLRAQYEEAVSKFAVTVSRLSFSGKMFNITFGGETVELPDRVLDVHIVAVDTQHHYTFYENSYTGTDADREGGVMSRYPLPTDAIEFTPTEEWAARAYKHRAIVMLANDPEHKLYVADFGYNSVKKVNNPQLGLLSLSALITQLDYISRQNPSILPFMFTVQLSFTKSHVPEVQFSLTNQLDRGNNQARFASQAACQAMVEALTSGEVDNLMKIEYDSGEVKKAQVAPQVQAQGGLEELAAL